MKFEDLMRNPAGVMSAVFAWLGLPPHDFDWKRRAGSGS